MSFFSFSHSKAFRDHIWPCHKKDQGQPGGHHLYKLSRMLHTMFQGNPFFGSWENDFSRVLPYIGMTVILVMWPRPNIRLCSPFPESCKWILIESWPSNLKEVIIWKWWQTTDMWPLAKVTEWPWPLRFTGFDLTCITIPEHNGNIT